MLLLSKYQTYEVLLVIVLYKIMTTKYIFAICKFMLLLMHHYKSYGVL